MTCLSAYPAYADGASWSERMDAIFAPAQADGVYAGSSVIIIEDRKVVFTKGYGFANDQGRRFTKSTRSYLGSVSKSFTGLAIAMLADQGKLDLDAPAQNYLPELQLANDASSITTRHLLNHTSGLSRYTGNRNQTDRDLSADGLTRTVADLAEWSLVTTPGEHYDYSNANYQILGRIIEVLTGQSYTDAMRTMVFDPLNMHHTTIGHNFADANAADGYRFWGPKFISHQEPMGIGLMPQGGVSTTAQDMGNYLISLMGGNASIPDMWLDEIATGHQLPETENYGAGWSVFHESKNFEDENLLLVHHGLNAGFTAAAALQPKRGRAIAVITNTADGFIAGDVAWVHNQALQAVFPELPAQRVDYGARYIQFGASLALVLSLLLWIGIAARRGFATNHLTLRLIVPTAGLLAIAYAISVLLPQLFGIPLSGMGVFSPDAGILLTLGAGLSFLWAIQRALLLILQI